MDSPGTMCNKSDLQVFSICSQLLDDGLDTRYKRFALFGVINISQDGDLVVRRRKEPALGGKLDLSVEHIN